VTAVTFWAIPAGTSTKMVRAAIQPVGAGLKPRPYKLGNAPETELVSDSAGRPQGTSAGGHAVIASSGSRFQIWLRPNSEMPR
jgi:hypothetical protein